MPVAARRHALVSQLGRNLLDRCDVPRGSPLVCGVSGGADSLALAIAAAVLGRRRIIDPIIVHVHHHLRGTEADQDAQYVEQFCARFGLPFERRDVCVPQGRGNVSAQARKARYAALAAAARAHRARFVAVAHHADDQFETLLMSLCRGSQAGLAGLRWARFIDEHIPEIVLVRPLLDQSRAECETLCRAAEVQWRTDSSNVDRRRSRARLRADVVPALESLWPGAAERAVATIRALAETREVVDDVIADQFGPASRHTWSRKDLAVLPPATLSAGIRRAVLHAIGLPGSDALPRRRIEQVVGAIRDDVRRPRRFQLHGGLVCIVRAREVSLVKGQRA